MATEAGGLAYDEFGNRIVYDADGRPEVILEPLSLPEWRTRLAPRLQQLGWEVPELDQLEGARLMQLERLLKEAGMMAGFTRRPPAGSVGDVLAGATIGGTPPTKDAVLDQIRRKAEELKAECAYNQEYVRPLREARLGREAAKVRQAALDRAAKDSGSQKANKILEAMDGYHP